MLDLLEDFKVAIINMFKGLKETMIKEVNDDMVAMSHKREYKYEQERNGKYEITKYIN